MKVIEELIRLTQAFLEGEIAADSFSEEFLGFFFDHENEVYAYDERIHSLLDDIRMGAAFFEPNEAIRAGDAAYLDEAKLRSIVRTALHEVAQYLVRRP